MNNAKRKLALAIAVLPMVVAMQHQERQRRVAEDAVRRLRTKTPSIKQAVVNRFEALGRLVLWVSVPFCSRRRTLASHVRPRATAPGAQQARAAPRCRARARTAPARAQHDARASMNQSGIVAEIRPKRSMRPQRDRRVKRSSRAP